MKKRPILLIFAGMLLVIGVAALLVLNQRKGESEVCAGQMFPLIFAGYEWADEHNGCFPTNLLWLSNNCPTTFLICPGDHSRHPAARWESFTLENSSYEIVTPGLRHSETNRAFLRCKIHGHLGYPDATVFDGVRRRKKFD